MSCTTTFKNGSSLNFRVRARLHLASASTLQQLCNDTIDAALIENNGVTQKWVATPIWSNSIVFIENTASTIAALLQPRRRHLV